MGVCRQIGFFILPVFYLGGLIALIIASMAGDWWGFKLTEATIRTPENRTVQYTINAYLGLYHVCVKGAWREPGIGGMSETYALECEPVDIFFNVDAEVHSARFYIAARILNLSSIVIALLPIPCMVWMVRNHSKSTRATRTTQVLIGVMLLLFAVAVNTTVLLLFSFLVQDVFAGSKQIERFTHYNNVNTLFEALRSDGLIIQPDFRTADSTNGPYPIYYLCYGASVLFFLTAAAMCTGLSRPTAADEDAHLGDYQETATRSASEASTITTDLASESRSESECQTVPRLSLKSEDFKGQTHDDMSGFYYNPNPNWKNDENKGFGIKCGFV